MVNELIKLMIDQEKYLQKLLELLDVQYDMMMKKDLFGLEGVVDKINECGKIIAKSEVARRKLLDKKSVQEVVNSSNNNELKQVYNSIQNTLKKVISKKETNEILLKQQLLFNTKMLNIMNPNRNTKIYNSYGNLYR